METLKILIIDDETPARELIRHYLQDYPNISIVGETDNGFDALKQIKELQPDLIFLDIQMPKLTGFELLELLEGTAPEIIFSTAFDHYAIQAFEQNAVDYLLKPYAKKRFDEAMQKALAKVNHGKLHPDYRQIFKETASQQPETLIRIAVKDQQQIYVIPIHEIYYFEAYGDYVKIHSLKGTFLKEKTMKYFEANLPQQQFIRIHRSYIVNVEEVSKIEIYEKDNYRVHLKNGAILKAGSNGYKALKGTIKW